MSASATRPRLLILSFSPIERDARVLKQVTHFAERYDVVTCGYGGAPAGSSRHLQIADDAPWSERRREWLVLRQYSRIYWHSAAIRAAQTLLRDEPRFDVVLANDIDTVGLALSLDPRGGVHADLHEYAPRLNEEFTTWRLFVAPYVRWQCRRFARRASSVTTVGQGIADEYRRVFGIEASVATNAAPHQPNLSPTPVGSPIRIVHSGAALRNRGIDEIIAAVEASTASVSLDLYLMPNDVGYLDGIRAAVAGSSRVTLHEPVPYAELAATLSSYDLGIHVIPPVSFNNRWALPNKFFDYVQARLGIIIGPSPEMARTLTEHDLGVVTNGFGADDIRQALDALTPERVAAWKQHAHAASASLSAEQQIMVWDAAVAAIAERGAR
ncbi:glycosyltransferase family 1 protein [Microcella sp.]|uniref:glycosyltransferase family 1 protein n=1 Tax=Microcella sp. TaxID=1913979 RepID=UPI003F719314